MINGHPKNWLSKCRMLPLAAKGGGKRGIAPPWGSQGGALPPPGAQEKNIEKIRRKTKSIWVKFNLSC